MRTDPSSTDPTPTRPPKPAPSWLSRLDTAAQRLWRRHILGPPPPEGVNWLPIFIAAAALTAFVLFMLAQLLDFLAHLLRPGVEGWGNADPAGMVTDPVHAFITEHTIGVGVDAATVFWTWAAAGVVFFLLSLAGSVGARIGWTLHGAATALMVFVGTADTGRPIATGLTVIFWAVLSMPAFRRTTSYANVDVPDVTAAIRTMDLGNRQARL